MSAPPTTDVRAVVVGTGSIGRRHLRNLRTLGVRELLAWDEDAVQLRHAVDETGAEPAMSLDRALATRPDVVLVCTPPSAHVGAAVAALEAGADVFVEKPLAAALDGVDDLLAARDRGGRIVQIGYNLQFEPLLEHAKTLVDDGALGRVVWARAEFGQYLPDWRPWQDYRRSYTARRDLGGGIVLDASHELAYLIWLLGRPTEVKALGGTVGDLEVDVEDSASILLRFANGAHADVHVDFLQRSPARTCKLVGTEGTLRLDLVTGEAELLPDGERRTFPPEEDLAYRAELSDFLKCVGTRSEPRVGVEFARDVLAVSLAAREQLE